MAGAGPGPYRMIRSAALRLLALGISATVLFASGCASTAGGQESATSVRPHAGAQRPERFSGPVADFYRVPHPLRRRKPGSLIRVQDLGIRAGAHSVRVMYHSRDVARSRPCSDGHDHVSRRAPAEAWLAGDVVGARHYGAGIAVRSESSRDRRPRVRRRRCSRRHRLHRSRSDRERHPYLSGPSEAHSVIDAVRAARLLPGPMPAGGGWPSAIRRADTRRCSRTNWPARMHRS